MRYPDVSGSDTTKFEKRTNARPQKKAFKFTRMQCTKTTPAWLTPRPADRHPNGQRPCC